MFSMQANCPAGHISCSCHGNIPISFIFIYGVFQSCVNGEPQMAYITRRTILLDTQLKIVSIRLSPSSTTICCRCLARARKRKRKKLFAVKIAIVLTAI